MGRNLEFHLAWLNEHLPRNRILPSGMFSIPYIRPSSFIPARMNPKLSAIFPDYRIVNHYYLNV
jgi:hypothetical protein